MNDKPHLNVGSYGRRSPMLGIAMLGLLAAALPPIDSRGVLPWPKGQPWDGEKQKRFSAERADAAEAKRKRRAAKSGASQYAKSNG